MKQAASRVIVHVDMDAFFASIEQRDHTNLRGRPVVVGGAPNSRGVVAAASYEARRFGIRSAMSCAQAYRLCPEAIFVRPRFHRYKAVSNQIMEIFERNTPVVEPLSLDEAYLDLTGLADDLSAGERTATQIRKEITGATGLTASAGVARNKFLAKLGSDLRKPDGLTVIDDSFVEDQLPTLPIRRLPGVGEVTEERMVMARILTVGDLRQRSGEELERLFGRSGSWFQQLAYGVDERPVGANEERKSIGVEDTFPRDISDFAQKELEISKLVVRLTQRLLTKAHRGRTVSVKMTLPNFRKFTRSQTLELQTNDPATILATALSLLRESPAKDTPVRLLGVSVSNLDDDTPEQIPLFQVQPRANKV